MNRDRSYVKTCFFRKLGVVELVMMAACVCSCVCVKKGNLNFSFWI